MSAPVQVDAEARLKAQTVFDRPLLVEAGAGTGKTAVLVARVVAWCLGPGWEKAAGEARGGAPDPDPEAVAAAVVRRVVAITFTEAAAAEMASRIAEALLEVRRGGALPAGLAREALPGDTHLWGLRAEALLGVLDQLAVGTIHAFCRRLLAEHPFEAGVAPGFEVDADGQARGEIAREVLEARLPTLLADPPDPDFATLWEAGLGLEPLEAALVELLGEGVLPADLEADPLSPERIDALMEPLGRALAHAVALDGGRLAAVRGASRLASLAQGLARLHEALGRQPVRTREALEAWLGQLPEILEGADLEKLGECARGGGLGSRGHEALGGDAEAWCEAAAALAPLLAHARRLRPAELAAARRLLFSLLTEARQRMQARGVESFGGLLRGARDCLRRHPEVAAEVRGGMDLLLVDEFQDTDALQCDMLELLALEGGASSRPSLFVVGDPKQSIYGFRSADLRAYDDFRERLGRAGGEVLALVENHRSVPAILAEVERLVRPVMHEARGFQPPFEALEASEALRGAAGFEAEGWACVEHWIARQPGEDGALASLRSHEATQLEAQALARDLLRLRAEGVALGRVGLLLRAASDLETYLDALREAGISYVVAREATFYQRREIVDIESLVRCILDPHDQTALVATLRSPLVGLPDAALLPLWTRDFPEQVAKLAGADGAALRELERLVEEALAPPAPAAAEAPAPDELASALLAFLATLGALRALHEEACAEDFVEALRAWLLPEAGEAARYQGRYRVARLDRFLRELTKALEAAGGSAAAVLANLRRTGALAPEVQEGRAHSSDPDAVQVMTIHGAKGLAFDHLYLLQTHKRSGTGGGSVAPTQVARRGDHVELRLMGLPSPGWVFVEEEKRRVGACERVRLLYVAATRARQRLVVSGLWPETDPAAPEQADSHAALLAWRAGLPEDLAVRLAELASRGEASWRDEAGVLWRLPAVAGAAPAPPPEVPASSSAAGDLAPRLSADVEALRASALRSAVRAARPISRAASAQERWAEERAARVAGEAEPAPWLPVPGPGEAQAEPAPQPAGDDAQAAAERRVALSAGTAVHEALERVDPAQADAEALGRVVAGSLAGLAPAERRAACARAAAILARFLEGPLAPRLRALAPHVLARELPVLLPPAEEAPPGSPAPEPSDEPVGFWSGAIDLLYRDPQSGELVVADYKTDAVEGEALRTRAATYAPQGALYTRAIQQALGLAAPPRFELWFLHAGQVLRL